MLCVNTKANNTLTVIVSNRQDECSATNNISTTYVRIRIHTYIHLYTIE